VLISFVIAGLGCLFAGLCYAEFASMIPESGSAYTYAYATMGRFMAWFIGWNMVLEYLVSASTWRSAGPDISSASCRSCTINFPAALTNAPFAAIRPFTIDSPDGSVHQSASRRHEFA
jgi:APA family basic amino acid/polyamine antiporter